MKFLRKINKKKFLIISPIIFFGVMFVGNRYFFGKGYLRNNAWLKENFNVGYVFVNDSISTI